MANVFYNRVIRKLIVGFGNLFNDITLVRYNPDQTEQERFLIPISYASKELYVQRLEGDVDLEKKVQITLPRFSFEMTGLAYDATRKQNTNIKNFAPGLNGNIQSQYNPVPYNFDFSLYLYVRNTEDATQAIEHILPYFTPDYTIKLNLIPEMGIIKEVPVVLNSTTQEIQYEGTRDSETRLIIWTLNFTVKGFIFGAVNKNTSGLVKNIVTNMISKITPEETIVLNAESGSGTYLIGEAVYQGFSLGTSTASGTVVGWTNNQLAINNTNGTFDLSEPLIGSQSNAKYLYSSFNPAGSIPQAFGSVGVTPNPADAFANGNYSYVTTIDESAAGGPVVVTGNANNDILYVPPSPLTDFTYIDLQT